MGHEYHLGPKGEIVEQPARIELKTNIKFAFRLFERLHNLQSEFSTDDSWWSSLCLSIKVRDRITHPKDPIDIDILPSEVTTLV